MKRAIKRALRPFVRPFNSRYASRSATDGMSRSLAEVSGYVDGLAARHHETRAMVESLNTHLPGMMAVITNQNAALRAARRGELRLEQIELRTTEMEGQFAGLVSRLDADLPPIVDAAVARQFAPMDPAGLVAAIHLLNERVAQLDQRIEFVRAETLYEVRYSLPRAEEPSAVADPEVASALLAEHSGRVNLGSGHIPVAGYLNVDSRPLDGVDLVADVTQLPFPEGSVKELRAAHLVEHFPREQLKRQLLVHWKSVIEPGGSLVLILPDAEAMIAAYERGEMSFDDLAVVTFGGQEYGGDFHFAMYTAGSLSQLLEGAGFADIEVTACARPNGLCLEMELSARRP
jgi:hypothetical protein